MPTRAGILTAVTALVFLICGRVFGIFELYIVAAAMLALVGCASIWVLVNWRSLDVRRVVNPPRLHAGDMSTVTLSLTNNRMIPTPVARITDEVEGATRADAHVPPIRRQSNTRASYRVPTERRGLIAIGPMKTRVIDPFGLASATSTTAPDTTLLVLPRIDHIAAPPQPGGNIAQQMDRSPNRVGPNGDEFSSLRSYAVGDDLRKVHWPSSARTGDLMVRNEHIPEHGHSLVLLDVRSAASDEDTFERMVSATASLIVACHARGDRIRFVTTAGFDRVAENTASYDALLDELAVVEQVPAPSITMPQQLSRPGTEAGAMVVAGDSETLIATMFGASRTGRGTYVVRFHSERAKPLGPVPRLASSRMIDIHHDDEFAAAWAHAVGASVSA